MKIKSSKVLKSLIAVILAVFMIVGTTVIGFAKSINIVLTGDNATIYLAPKNAGYSEGFDSNGKLKSNYTLKANFKFDSADGGKWASRDFYLVTDVTYKGSAVYRADIFQDWGGLDVLQLQLYKDSGFNQQKEVFNTFTSTSVWDGKIYDSSWNDYHPDCKVTFDANGHGTAPTSQTVYYNNKATEPTAPSEEGWIFGGWYENSSCTGSAWNFNTAITGDKKFYAKWTSEEKYTIKKSETPTGVTGTVTVNNVSIDTSGKQFQKGTYITNNKVTAPTGYVITSVTGGGTWSIADNKATATCSSISVNSNFTISVSYEQVFTITTAASPSSAGTVSVSGKAGATTQATLTATASAKHAFKEWTLPSTVTLVSGYKLTDKEIKVNARANSTVTAEFEDMYFYRGSGNGWDVSKMTKSTDGNYFYIQAQSTSDTFKITDDEGGSWDSPTIVCGFSNWTQNFLGNDPTKAISGVQDGSNNNLKISGYGSDTTYILFYPSISYNSKSYTNVITASKFLPSGLPHQLKYNKNTTAGVSDLPSEETVANNKFATQPSKNPSRTGYTFGGWYKESACTTQWNFTKDTVTADTTLYAKWTANTQTVTFDANGGTCDVATVVVTYDSTYGAAFNDGNLPVPTYEKYHFLGWFTSKSGTSEVKSNTKVTITTNQTLYAHWAENKATITVNCNEGTPTSAQVKLGTGTAANVVTGKIGSVAANATSLSVNATPDGYRFLEWRAVNNDGDYPVTITNPTSESGATVYFTETITDDTTTTNHATITAVFTRISYNHTTAAKGSINGSDRIDSDDDINFSDYVTVTNPVLFNDTITYTAKEPNGYSFVGWYKETACTNRVSQSKVYSITQTTGSAKSYYALFKKNYTLKIDSFTNVSNVEVASGSTTSVDKGTTLTFLAGDKVTLTATPASGYVFAYWTSDNNEFNGANNVEATSKEYTFNSTTGDVTFKPNVIDDPGKDKQIIWYDNMGTSWWTNTPRIYLWNDQGKEDSKYSDRPEMTRLYKWNESEGNLVADNLWFYVADIKENGLYTHAIVTNGSSDDKSNKTYNIDNIFNGAVIKATTSEWEKPYNTDVNDGATSIPIKLTVVAGEGTKSVVPTVSGYVMSKKSQFGYKDDQGHKGYVTYEAGTKISATPNNGSTHHFNTDGWIISGGTGVFANQKIDALSKFVPITADSFENGVTLTAKYLENEYRNITMPATLPEGVTGMKVNSGSQTQSASVISGTTNVKIEITRNTDYYLTDCAVYKANDQTVSPKFTKTIGSNYITLSEMPDYDIVVVPTVAKMYKVSASVYKNKASDSSSTSGSVKFLSTQDRTGNYYKPGSTVKLEATAKSGYDFIGWYKDSNFTIKLTSDSTYTTTMGNAAINLYVLFAKKVYVAGPATYAGGDKKSGWDSTLFYSATYEPSNNSYFYYFENPYVGQNDGYDVTHSQFSFYKNNVNTSTNEDKIPIGNSSGDYAGTGVTVWVPENHNTNNPHFHSLDTANYKAPVKLAVKCANSSHTAITTGEPETLLIFTENSKNSVSAMPKNTGHIVISNGKKLISVTDYSSTTSFVDKSIPCGITKQAKENDENYESYRVASIIPGQKEYEIKTTLEGTNADQLKAEAFVLYDNTTKTSKKIDVTVSGNTYKGLLSGIEDTHNYYVCPVLVHSDKYYQSNSNDKQIKVYVDKSEIPASWGGLVAIYTWSSDSSVYTHGNFPGQLLIPTDDGRLYTYIESNKDKFDGCLFTNYYENTAISAETSYFNNYCGAGVTASILQTYDYREPYSLYKAGYDSLTFNFKIGDTKYHGKSNRCDISKHTSREITTSNITPSEFTDKWEYLTARDGETLLDLKNDKITDKSITDNPSADYYVVCKGDVYYKLDKTYGYDNNYTGKWSVDWYIYDSQGTYLGNSLSASIFDKILINPETGLKTSQSYLADNVLSGKDLSGKVVKICYEAPNDSKDPNGGDDNKGNYSTTTRYSGQWTGANAFERVSANIKVGTTTAATYETISENSCTISPSNKDTFGNAYLGSEEEPDITKESIDVLLSNGNISMKAEPQGENQFIGFYVFNDKNSVYEQISASEIFEYNITNNTNIYAIFKPLPAGSIVFANSIYSNNDPALGDKSNGGKVKTYIELYSGPSATGTLIAASELVTNGTAKITHSMTYGNTYTVLLRTITYQDSTFNSWYVLNDQTNVYTKNMFGSTDEIIPNGTVTGTFTFVASSAKRSYYFYSDAYKPSDKVVLEYRYKDRFGVQKSYVVNDKLADYELYGTYNDDSEIYPGNNGTKYTPTYRWTQKWTSTSNANDILYTSADKVEDIKQPSGYQASGNPFNTVMDKAPKGKQVTIYGQDVKWELTDQTFVKGSSHVTLTAVQTKQTYKIKYHYKNSSGVDVIESYSYNGSTDIPENTLVMIDKTKVEEYKGFKYWRKFDSSGQKDIYLTNNPEYGMVAAEDIEIEAVYDAPEFDGWQCTLSSIKKTRQISGESTSKTDNCYVDFIAAFNDGKGTKVKDNSKVQKYGIVYVINTNTSDKHTYEDYLAHKDDGSSYWKYPTDLPSADTIKDRISSMTTSSIVDSKTYTNRYFFCYDCKALGYDTSSLNRAQIQSPALKTASYGPRSFTAYSYIQYDGTVYLSEGYNFYLADQLDPVQ